MSSEKIVKELEQQVEAANRELSAAMADAGQVHEKAVRLRTREITDFVGKLGRDVQIERDKIGARRVSGRKQIEKDYQTFCRQAQGVRDKALRELETECDGRRDFLNTKYTEECKPYEAKLTEVQTKLLSEYTDTIDKLRAAHAVKIKPIVEKLAAEEAKLKAKKDAAEKRAEEAKAVQEADAKRTEEAKVDEATT